MKIHCEKCDKIFSSKEELQRYNQSEDEITTHLAIKHEEILATIDPVNTEFENWICEEYLQFFCPE